MVYDAEILEFVFKYEVLKLGCMGNKADLNQNACVNYT